MKCSDIPPGICQNFHQTVGFGNIFYGYFIAICFCVFLSTLYAFFIYFKYNNIVYVIKWHVGIFLVNMTILFWVPSVIFSWSCSVSGPCSPVVFFGSVFTLGSIALVVLDLLISPEVKYFKRQKEAEETSVILEKMKRAKPELGVIINCYHNVKQKSTNKVTTFTDHREFPIDSFLDETDLPSSLNNNVTLFYIALSITAGDSASAEVFNQFKNRFIAANQHRDEAMEATIGMTLQGFIEEETTIFGKYTFPTSSRLLTVQGQLPWWANQTWSYAHSVLNISIIQR